MMANKACTHNLTLKYKVKYRFSHVYVSKKECLVNRRKNLVNDKFNNDHELN